jgi:hypothetical protein
VNSRQRNRLFNDKLSDKELNQHYQGLSRRDNGLVYLWNAILCTNLKITSIPFQMIQIQIVNTFTNLEYKDLHVHKVWIKRHKWGFRVEAWREPGVAIFHPTTTKLLRKFEYSEPDCCECKQNIFFSDDWENDKLNNKYPNPEVSHKPDCKLGLIEKIMNS